MKFNCGEHPKVRRKRLEAWHLWFAWHPVQMPDGDCVWLEYVGRQGDYSGYTGDWEWRYQHVELAPLGEKTKWE